MKRFKKWAVVGWAVLGLVLSLDATAQRRPPRQKPTTAGESIDNAGSAKEKRDRAMWNDLQTARNRHANSQDKATRKRMKRSLRKARRNGQNRSLPWWKRVFSRQRYD